MVDDASTKTKGQSQAEQINRERAERLDKILRNGSQHLSRETAQSLAAMPQGPVQQQGQRLQEKGVTHDKSFHTYNGDTMSPSQTPKVQSQADSAARVRTPGMAPGR